MKNKFKLLLVAVFVSVATGAVAEVNVMLYKPHGMSFTAWQNLSLRNNGLIDPNGDGNTSDSTWTSPEQASSNNSPPTSPEFQAFILDSSGAQIGEIN